MAKLSKPAPGVTRVHSGVTLRPVAGSITVTRSNRAVSMASFNTTVRSVLKTARAAEQYYVNQNWASYKHARTIGYTSAAGRALKGKYSRYPSSMVCPSKVDEAVRTEANRLLSSAHERLEVWEKIQAGEEWSPGAGDYELWRNLKRTSSKPSKPVVKRPVLPYSATNGQLQGERVLDNGKVRITGMAIGPCRYNLTISIPGRILERHPGIVSVTAPSLRLDANNQPVFTMSIVEDVPEPPAVNTGSFLAVDLGKTEPMTVRRVDGNGRGERFTLAESITTLRVRRAIARREDELGLALARRDRVEAAGGVPSDGLLSNIDGLRARLERGRADYEWQRSWDVARESRPGEPLVFEKLNFNTGGPVHFRSGQMGFKMEHVAAKQSLLLKRVNAAGTSQKCPECGDGLDHPEWKKSACKREDCKYTGDRDETACIVIGQRAAGVKPSSEHRVTQPKGRPTPRRPRQESREPRTWAFNNAKNKEYLLLGGSRGTGANPNAGKDEHYRRVIATRGRSHGLSTRAAP